MEIYSVGKAVPDSLMQLLLDGPQSERAFINAPKNGTINLYIILRDITPSEIKSFEGEIVITVQEYEIPMLIVAFQGMSFDMPIVGDPDRIEEANATNLYIIDLNGYVLKHIRLLGLNHSMVSKIHKGILFTSSIKTETLIEVMHKKIYPKYSPKAMMQGGEKQAFQR